MRENVGKIKGKMGKKLNIVNSWVVFANNLKGYSATWSIVQGFFCNLPLHLYYLFLKILAIVPRLRSFLLGNVHQLALFIE